jgi:hypothetical protein
MKERFGQLNVKVSAQGYMLDRFEEDLGMHTKGEIDGHNL